MGLARRTPRLSALVVLAAALLLVAGAGFALGRATGGESVGATPSRRVFTGRQGDVLRVPAAAAQCVVSGEGGAPNLICAHTHNARYEVVFYADSLYLYRNGFPEDPIFVARARNAFGARPPTFREQEGIVTALPASLRNTPVECLELKLRVSSRNPRYASVGGTLLNWEKAGSRCIRFGSNWGYILKKGRRWKIIYEGTELPSCSLKIPRDLTECLKP